ncbi:ribonuclease T2 family protein [Fuscibacter oryzae]|uniref:Ribonuclease T2 n=1 Tax=Fuscibacter oryzae TaxID=2803939 RepID=A0A8J7MRX1_9RHOB|nr:ribonuclease T2 [Fuscibacter oryzae]MBL4928888.1 ribonuclease T2 [Fuscibacter oryzae]
MRRLALALAAFCFAAPAWAEGERAGDFDYYVMSLSWSSNWCALTGDARGDPQCQTGRGLTWVLHGLWPQKEQGWPSYCRTAQRDPTRAETAAMADIMGGSGLAFYQWKKHGRCAGQSAPDFYKTARAAHDSITLPPVFARIRKDMTLPASVIEDAFLEANPGLTRDEITVTCDQGMIQEVRICLTKDLSPRACAPDSARDCRMKDAELDAVR